MSEDRKDADRDCGMMAAVMFASREAAHRAHLAVTGPGSFAKHSALGDFYGAIGDAADRIVEAYQGRHDVIVEIGYVDDDRGAIDEVLARHLKVIEGKRECLGDDSPIQNMVDEAIGLYLSTLYKLRKLR